MSGKQPDTCPLLTFTLLSPRCGAGCLSSQEASRSHCDVQDTQVEHGEARLQVRWRAHFLCRSHKGRNLWHRLQERVIVICKERRKKLCLEQLNKYRVTLFPLINEKNTTRTYERIPETNRTVSHKGKILRRSLNGSFETSGKFFGKKRP